MCAPALMSMYFFVRIFLFFSFLLFFQRFVSFFFVCLSCFSLPFSTFFFPLSPTPLFTRQQKNVGVDDLIVIGGSYDGDVQSVVFQRALSVSDANDRNISAGKTDIIWALGAGDALNPEEHDPDDRGSTQVDFFGNNNGSDNTAPTPANFIQFPCDIYFTMQWEILNSSSAHVKFRELNVPVIQVNLSLGQPAGGYWMAVGLGRSMSKADVMMVSVASNGTAYAVDRTAIGEQLPIPDTAMGGKCECKLLCVYCLPIFVFTSIFLLFWFRVVDAAV